jgi:beta-lactamase regulating signal transducer with metallopeptidase domain
MIAAWMAYAVLISLLLCLSGVAIERACRVRRWPTRWVWAVALAAPFVLPLAATRVDESPVRGESALVAETAAPGTVSALSAPMTRIEHRAYKIATSPGPASLLVILWIGGSTLLALAFARSWLRLRRKSNSWSGGRLDGVEVLVSNDTGPAVIGFWHPRIVVPKWLLRADEHVRRLALTHESEHVRARDPLLLLGATLAVVLLPWNLPLWWQWRRLRFAIEVDCDARVLSSGCVADAEYAEALLNVAERSAGIPLAAAAMCESPATLEQRIRLFLRDGTSRQRALTFAFLLGGMSIAAAATQIAAPPTLDRHAQQRVSDRAMGELLLEAIGDGDRDTAVALIDAGADVDRIEFGDGTPLIVAARSGDASLVNLLLERGAHVDIPVRGDGSPLIAASALGNIGIVTALVERGADVNGFVLGDETPLINATRGGHLDVTRYLVARGADVNLAVAAEAGSNPEIRSPLGEARKHGHASVVEYLRSQGAR